MSKLDELRKEIDEIDGQMAALFGRRMSVAAGVAEYKREHGLPVLDAGREDAVLQKNLARLDAPALKEYYEDYLRHLMGLSRQYQAAILGANTVAYQGAQGGFGHRVAVSLYPHAVLQAKATFAAIFEAVDEGSAAYGVVPFENSSTGDVSEVLDLCYSHRCHVAGVYDLPVTQNLLALPGAQLCDIKKVVSHPQALQQSRRFLSNLNVELEAFANTALAAKQVAELGDASVAAVASLDAAELYGLVPLAKDIATDTDNTTRFILITRALPAQGDRLSLFVTVENGVGRLAKIIEVIAAEGFDMENIKSRPMQGRPWEYYFYIELVGEPGAHTDHLLEKIRQVSLSVRLLGVYYRHKLGG